MPGLTSSLLFTPLATDEEVDWCARLMASTEPWLTLGRTFDESVRILRNPTKEVVIARIEAELVGFLILDMSGPFPGYIQTVCIAPQWRRRVIGSQMIAYAEERIFRESPNVFLCVSSFNKEARRLYARLGYEIVGALRSYIVAEHDEILLRKTRGPWRTFTPLDRHSEEPSGTNR